MKSENSDLKTRPRVAALRRKLAEALRELRAARREPKPDIRRVLIEAAADGWRGSATRDRQLD